MAQGLYFQSEAIPGDSQVIMLQDTGKMRFKM